MTSKIKVDIFEMIEEAKKSEFGMTWFSERGIINISKDGILSPVRLSKLPKYSNNPWMSLPPSEEK